LAKVDNKNVVWKFKFIALHQSPLSAKHLDFKGSIFNVMVEWDNRQTTMKTLQIISKDEPVTYAIYAKDNG
jgi:hypothetical protein